MAEGLDMAPSVLLAKLISQDGSVSLTVRLVAIYLTEAGGPNPGLALPPRVGFVSISHPGFRAARRGLTARNLAGES